MTDTDSAAETSTITQDSACEGSEIASSDVLTAPSADFTLPGNELTTELLIENSSNHGTDSVLLSGSTESLHLQLSQEAPSDGDNPKNTSDTVGQTGEDLSTAQIIKTATFTLDAHTLDEVSKPKEPEEQSIASSLAVDVEDWRDARIRELTSLCERQAKDNYELNKRLEQQEVDTGQFLTKLNEEQKKRIEHFNRLYEECRSEKDAMVVKYAQAEQRCIEAQRSTERCEQRIRDAQRNAASQEQRLRQAQSNLSKLQTQYDARCSEVNSLRSELDRAREAVNSGNYQLKSTASKLKEEQDAHVASKQRLDAAQKTIATQRDELVLLKQKCDELSAASQKAAGSADSNDTKKKESPSRQSPQKDADVMSSILLKEVNALKREVSTLREENAKLRELEARNEALRSEIEKLNRRVSELEAEKLRLEGELNQLSGRYDAETAANNVAQSQIRAIERDRDSLREQLVELQNERSEMIEKQSELLMSIERANSCNSTVNARNAELNARLDAALTEANRTSERCQLIEARASEERATLHRELTITREQLAASSADSKRIDQELASLRRSHDDLLDEYVATRRKLEANLKDVTKQLDRFKRKAEALESAASLSSASTQEAVKQTAPSTSNEPETERGAAKRVGSGRRRTKPQSEHRSNSIHDLPALAADDIPQVGIVDAQFGNPTAEFSPGGSGMLPDRMALVEKLVRLQNLHAAKIEKIEFYRDHVRQLNEDLRKKSRLIQYYFLREEAGQLNDASAIPVDPNKAHLLSKKPSILTQLYAQATGVTPNQHEFLHLGQVNTKLQALLEDTLVKNITLKENLDTLSREVSRLSNEISELKR